MTMKPMINPYKDRPLAKLCRNILRTLSPKWPREVGQRKEKFQSGTLDRVLEKKKSCTGRATILRRRTEEKLTRAPTVAAYHIYQEGKSVPLRLKPKSHKVVRCLLPSLGPFQSAYTLQRVKPPQLRMATAKPLDHGSQPAGNQPWRHQALRIHLLGCTIKALLPIPPTLHPQHQRPQHGTDSVLKVRN
jgi:hypothetical protein